MRAALSQKHLSFSRLKRFFCLRKIRYIDEIYRTGDLIARLPLRIITPKHCESSLQKRRIKFRRNFSDYPSRPNARSPNEHRPSTGNRKPPMGWPNRDL